MVTNEATLAPIRFVQLLADEQRWRLLQELARSDRKVGERHLRLPEARDVDREIFLVRDPRDGCDRGESFVRGEPPENEYAQRLARVLQRPARSLPGPLAKWTRTRELKPIPKETFREWWSRERGA